jgi:hypothetical protein
MAVWASVSRFSVRIAFGGACLTRVFVVGVIWNIIEAANRSPLVLGVVEHDISIWTIVGGIGLFGALNKEPHELHNLADAPNYQEQLMKMRTQLNEWIKKTDDKGQYPEGEPNLRHIHEKWGYTKCINPAPNHLAFFRNGASSGIASRKSSPIEYLSIVKLSGQMPRTETITSKNTNTVHWMGFIVFFRAMGMKESKKSSPVNVRSHRLTP